MTQPTALAVFQRLKTPAFGNSGIGIIYRFAQHAVQSARPDLPADFAAAGFGAGHFNLCSHSRSAGDYSTHPRKIGVRWLQAHGHWK